MKVTLTQPGIAGEYVVAEHRADGTLVLRPETSDEVIERFADRTLDEGELLDSFDRLDAALEREGRYAAIERRLGVEPASEEEFERHFGHLPRDGEG